MNLSLHRQTRFAGKTMSWLPSDTRELWIESMKDKTKRKYLEIMNWHNEEAITYKFNSQGFRCDEFTKNGFIALGCSFTMGTGLEQCQIWPELLSSKLNIPVNNLGVYSASLDTCYRLLENYIDVLQPQFVVLCSPPIHRFEILNDSTGRIITPHAQINDELCRTWYAHDDNSKLNSRKNVRAMADLCNEKSCPFYTMPDLITFDDARDFQHSGPLSHKKMVEEFLATAFCQ